MRLAIVLYGFYWLFKFTCWTSSRFKEKLGEKDFTMVMKSKDDTIARTYMFDNGKVYSKRGIPQNPACSFIWKTPAIGAKIMIDVAKGNPKAIGRAVIKGNLMLEGEAALISWFLEVLKMLGSIYSKKK